MLISFGGCDTEVSQFTEQIMAFWFWSLLEEGVLMMNWRVSWPGEWTALESGGMEADTSVCFVRSAGGTDSGLVGAVF